MLKLRYFRYFTAVAEELSFSRAAERLHISQSALSRQVRLFEEELGVRVFDRIGRRIELTAAGRDLLRRSRALLNDVDLLGQRAEAFADGSGGVLRVGATPQTLESVLSKFLVELKLYAPKIKVELMEDGAARLEDRVAHGDLELAIAGLTPGTVLEGRSLFPLGALAVVPDNSPLRSEPHVEISRLAMEPLLLLQRQFMTRRIFDGICQVANVRPRVFLESNSPHCLLSFVRAAHGIAVVPSTVLLGDLDRNAVPICHNEQQLGFHMSVIWDPRRYLSSAAELFVERLVSATREDYPGKAFDFAKNLRGLTLTE